MSTHAHFKGEFGSKRMSGMSKDPAYRAGRAAHYARLATEANEKHATSNTKADRAAHALVAATAVQKAKKHLEAVRKLAPGSEHEEHAFQAHHDAKMAHADIEMRHDEKTTQPIPVEKMRDVIPPTTTGRSRTTTMQTATEKMLEKDTIKRTEAEKRPGATSASTAITTQIPIRSGEHSDAHLAEIIHQAVASAPDSGRIGDRKVFIHEVYNAMSKADRAKFGTLDQFKDKLRDLHKSSHVELARADLVAAMKHEQVVESHMNLINLGHHKDVPSSTNVPHVNFVIDKRFDKPKSNVDPDGRTSKHLDRTAAVVALTQKIGDHWHRDAIAQLRRDPDVAEITKYGQHTSVDSGTVVKHAMADGECHWNSSKLYKSGEVDAIVIGYARNSSGWHQHTWGEKNGKIVETTASNFGNTEYFGMKLSDREAQAFSRWTEANPPGRGMVRTEKQEKLRRE